MDNNFDKAIEIINDCHKKCKCCIGPMGPRGFKGEAETIVVRSTTTVDPSENADVVDTKNSLVHLLDFKIPKGEKGDVGPKGNDGASVTILGSYDTYEELIREHPVGNVGDGYLVGDDLYVWSENTNTYNNVGRIRGPQGERGEVGPEGPAGESIDRSCYLVTFNNGTDEGIIVPSGSRIPIDREELDISDIVTLDTKEDTIQFNVVGYYKITFMIFGYADSSSIIFDPTSNFVSVGFRLVGTDDIFVGGSSWSYTSDSTLLSGQGILAVTDISNVYELVNLSAERIFLNTPNIKYIKSESYFTNPILTIVIDYLGRQGV